MLEETGLPYEPHRIDILKGENHDPAFLALNPNGKNPAIYDPDGPSGTPLALFESGAILVYLADKTGQFISADPNTRYDPVGDVADGVFGERGILADDEARWRTSLLPQRCAGWYEAGRPLGAPGRRVESIIRRGRERLAPGPARRTVTNAARRGPRP